MFTILVRKVSSTLFHYTFVAKLFTSVFSVKDEIWVLDKYSIFQKDMVWIRDLGKEEHEKVRKGMESIRHLYQYHKTKYLLVHQVNDMAKNFQT